MFDCQDRTGNGRLERYANGWPTSGVGSGVSGLADAITSNGKAKEGTNPEDPQNVGRAGEKASPKWAASEPSTLGNSASWPPPAQAAGLGLGQRDAGDDLSH